ncbi:hypothetical protein [Sphaerisporangium perillae]|uniref:hypothetical protein n=1 Tax=Sphaerisporangium perillae TaxID=2935860 RepID=UPI00200EDEAB|nr:hypothetical protein [Sphaerisporangium perillae]
MAAHAGYIWRVARGVDNKVYTSGTDDSGRWDEKPVHPNWRTENGMALADYSGRLWMFLRGMDGFLLAATWTPNEWSGIDYVGGTQAIKLVDEPAAASHDGQLYVMYRR